MLSPVETIFVLVSFYSHVIVYVLSIVGLPFRPFSRILWDFSSQRPSFLPASAVVWCIRQVVLFLYPWIHLTEAHERIAGTPSRLWLVNTLLIHVLWLTSSIGLWALFTLASVKVVLPYISPAFGPITDPEDRVVVLTLMVIYAGVFTAWSSLMWLLSLRRSLAHFFRYTSSGRDGGDLDDARHYLAPFRKATVWAFASLPIFFGYAVLSLTSDPTPFQ